MDATGVNSGAKAAMGTLKESIAIGKEGGKMVADLQADAHNAVLEQQRIRDRERRKQEQLGSQQEQKAYHKFVAKQEEIKATEDLKKHILKTHGPAGWNEFLKAKLEVETQDKLDSKNVSNDEQRMSEMTWWCFAAGAAIAYMIVGR